MTPQRQLISHNPDMGYYGDCYRTCMAVVMGMDAKDVPHFCDGDASDLNGIKGARDWLRPMGFGIWQNIYLEDVSFKDMLNSISHFSVDIPVIITGQRTKGVNHCVVAVNGKVICDPLTGEANRKPFNGPAVVDGNAWWWVEVIAKLPPPKTT